MFNSSFNLNRLARLALACFAVCWLARPAASQSSPVFFYSGGHKHFLKPSTVWVGLAVAPGAALDTVEKAVAARTAKTTAKAVRRPVRNRRLGVLALPLAPGVTRQSFQKVPGVRRLLRVFGDGPQPVVETDELLVQFKAEVSETQRAALLAKAGAVAVAPLGRYAPNGFLARVADPARMLAIDAANTLYGRPEVVFAHANLVWPKTPRFTPNDPLYAQQWHLHNTGAGGGTAGADIKASQAWDISRGSSSVVIAISDTGLDIAHEEFAGRTVAGYDWADHDTDPRPNATNSFDEHHATSAAGVATAAGNNSKGVSGVAPGCRLMPVRLLGDGETLQDEADSFTWMADHGAAVINCSWGPTDGLGVEQPLPDATRAAIDYAVTNGRGGKGCVIAWAAGNGNESSDLDGYASYDKVINVAASTNLDKRASYSDFGASVDVCAPSNGGTLDIVTTDRTGNAGYNPGTFFSDSSNLNYTLHFGGTSSAAPVVTGLAALMISVNPNLAAAQVRQLLQDTADKINPAGGAYNAAGHSNKYGFGRVNALRALQAARDGLYSVSGSVTLAGGAGAAGVTVAVAGSSLQATTDAAGHFTVGALAAGSVTLVPTKPSYSFTPASKTVTLGPSATGIAFTAQPPPFPTLLAPLPNTTVGGATTLRARTANDAAAQRVDFARRPHPVTITRAPNKAINDDSTITDTATVTGSGTVAEASVTVNIQHTYIGDLQVTLIAPDGTRVILHNHVGGDTANLVKTYANVAVTGKTIAGAWKLEVIDNAPGDTGTLKSWGMTLAQSWTKIAGDTDGPSGGEWTALWNTATTPPGVYEVRALAVATSGSYSDINANVIVRGGLPTITMSRPAPAPDNYYKTLASATGTATGTTPLHVTGQLYRYANGPTPAGYWAGGNSWTATYSAANELPATGAANWTFTLPTLAPGKYRLRMTVADGSGHSAATAAQVLLIDPLAPTVSVTRPAAPPDNFYKSLTTASGTALDNGPAGLDEVTVQLYRYANATEAAGYWAGGATWTATYAAGANEIPATGLGNWSLALPDLAPGKYWLRATARDNAGNSAQSERLTFTIDVESPSVNVAHPLPGSYPSLASAAGIADDTGGSSLAQVTGQFYRYATATTAAGYWAGGNTWTATASDANEITATGAGNWSFALPALAPGKYRLRMTATDRAGNATSASVVFTISGAS